MAKARSSQRQDTLLSPASSHTSLEINPGIAYVQLNTCKVQILLRKS